MGTRKLLQFREGNYQITEESAHHVPRRLQCLLPRKALVLDLIPKPSVPVKPCIRHGFKFRRTQSQAPPAPAHLNLVGLEVLGQHALQRGDGQLDGVRQAKLGGSLELLFQKVLRLSVLGSSACSLAEALAFTQQVSRSRSTCYTPWFAK